jgi:exosortase H (IPTLxxWG-CTERM-specific)
LGYRKEKKRKNKPVVNWATKFKTRWRSRYPVLLFVGVFAFLMGVFYFLWSNEKVYITVFQPLSFIYAEGASIILNLFGYKTQVSGATIFSSDFAISVMEGCDAMEGIALFCCGIIAFPASWKRKLIGLAIGIVSLFLLNFLRIISLFMIGIAHPDIFELMHIEVWQVIFIILAIILLLLWLRYAVLKIKPNADAKH